ncbi:MAG TPA: TlpA disulfide reductase family protein [bacterium]|nr:TlpA disulfide reductase family protein [bacterium]
MKKLTLTILILLLSTAVCSGMEYTQEKLFEKLRGADSPEKATEVFTDYIKNMPDLDTAHRIYEMWASGDAAAADTFMAAMRTDPAMAGRLKYFEGAAIDGLLERRDYARKLIAADTDLFEAYALLFDLYTRWLFQEPLGDIAPQGSVTEKDLEALETGFSDDNLKMVRIRDWKDAGKHLYLVYKYMAYYAVYKNHPDDAYTYMKEGDALNADWIDYSHLAVQAVRNRELDAADAYINRYVEFYISHGVLKEENRAEMKDSLLTYALVYGRAYDAAIERIQTRPGYLDDAEALQQLADIYARKNAPDKVFEYLNMSVDKGFSDVDSLKTDPVFEPFRSDDRWTALITRVTEKWEAGEKERAKQAVAQKIEKDAPDWELKTPEGKTYKLSDFRGKKVVVLDFWATWCGPCMMAMPELDAWCKKEKPDAVEVFSINTWERKPEDAKKLFKDRKFAMILLMDGDKTAQEYGVRGIPYICVIDKNGKIRYEMKGFSKELEQNLTYWVKDLLQ